MLKSVISLIKYYFSLVLRPKKVSVLMYHSVSDNNKFFTVSLKNFERQLKFLKNNNFNIISAEELKNIFEDKEKLKAKTIFLTFDDGYDDNYFNVLSLIKKYNVNILIFIITDLIGEDGYLNWRQIFEMKKTGLVEFGCHTKSHLDLDKLSKTELEKEILESKKIIEKKIGEISFVFSYPKGKYNDLVVETVKKRGFDLAFTVKEGTVGLKNDTLKLPRLSIDSSTNWWQFLGKISGLFFVKGKI